MIPWVEADLSGSRIVMIGPAPTKYTTPVSVKRCGNHRVCIEKMQTDKNSRTYTSILTNASYSAVAAERSSFTSTANSRVLNSSHAIPTTAVGLAGSLGGPSGVGSTTASWLSDNNGRTRSDATSTSQLWSGTNADLPFSSLTSSESHPRITRLTSANLDSSTILTQAPHEGRSTSNSGATLLQNLTFRPSNPSSILTIGSAPFTSGIQPTTTTGRQGTNSLPLGNSASRSSTTTSALSSGVALDANPAQSTGVGWRQSADNPTFADRTSLPSAVASSSMGGSAPSSNDAQITLVGGRSGSSGGTNGATATLSKESSLSPTLTRPPITASASDLPYVPWSNFASEDAISSNVLSLPEGASIQTITKTECADDAFWATTTSSGSTVTTTVPELCVDGFAFLFFGLGGIGGGGGDPKLPALCHKSLSFPLGIVWTLICPPNGGDPEPKILHIDPPQLNKNDPTKPPNEQPNDRPDDDPDEDQDPSASFSRTRSRPSQSEPSATRSTSRSSTSSFTTSTSSASATPGRYVVSPKLNADKVKVKATYDKFKDADGATKHNKKDGSVDFWAADLNPQQIQMFSVDPDFILVVESKIKITEPEWDEDGGKPIVSVPRADSSALPTVTAQAQRRRALKRRAHRQPRRHHKDKRALELLEYEKPHLQKRWDPDDWTTRRGSWAAAMVSRPPYPNQRLRSYDPDFNEYAYIYNDRVQPGEGVRIYFIDTGLNMEHPEFLNRARVRDPKTEQDWDIDWLFPQVDNDEAFQDDSTSPPSIRRYTFSYVDPNEPRSRPNQIHQAYSDYRRIPHQNYGSKTPHGTRLSGSIIGETLGLATHARYTVVKLPMYTNGPMGREANIPLFSARSALGQIVEDIQNRRSQGERLFAISSSLGFLFGDLPSLHNPNQEEAFNAMWTDFLDWYEAEGVTVVTSSGNLGTVVADIIYSPAKLIKPPHICAGSVTPDGVRHPGSQGFVDEVPGVTVYAPGSGIRIVSNEPDAQGGRYIYENARQDSAATSQACAHTVGYVAYILALGYAGYADVNPGPNQRPNQYAYDRVKSLRAHRRRSGAQVIWNGAPEELWCRNQDGRGRQKLKRQQPREGEVDDEEEEEGEGSCPISFASTSTTLPPTAASPTITPSVSPPPPPPPKPTFECWTGNPGNHNPSPENGGDWACICSQENWQATSALPPLGGPCPTTTWNTNPPVPAPTQDVVVGGCHYPGDIKGSCLFWPPGNGPGGYIPTGNCVTWFCKDGKGGLDDGPHCVKSGACPPLPDSAPGVAWWDDD